MNHPMQPESAKISQNTSSVNQETTEVNGPLGGWSRTRQWIEAHTQWIVKNLNWSKLKPVIRCAVVGWVSLVLFVIPRVETFLGQASFILLIAVFFAPPSDPFVSVLEREILMLFLVSIAWAWTCLGIFLANLARRVHNPAATLFDVVNGQYIEAAPTVILGIFIFFGSAFFLYIKTRQGPGPYLFGCIFACLCIDIALTTCVLFPFPFFLIGKTIILPLAFASALALLGSIFIFPSTVSAQFTTRLQDVLTPLISAIDHHRALLTTPFPIESDTSSSSMNLIQYTEKVNAALTSIKASETALGPLAASARLMKSDLIYCRFSPQDFKAFHKMCRRMAARSNGLATYFSLVGVGPGAGMGLGSDKSEGHTPAHTVPNTPVMGTPVAPLSRTTSLERVNENQGQPDAPTISSTSPSTRSHSKVPSLAQRLSLYDLQQHHSHSHSHNQLHTSLLPPSRLSYDKPNKGQETEHAVGTFESQRYLNLEATRLWDPNREEWTRQAMQALGESCDPVLETCRDGLAAVHTWLGGVRKGRITHLLGIRREERHRQIDADVKQMKELKDKVSGVLELFRSEKRLRIIDHYRPAFKTSKAHSRKDPTSHTADITATSEYDLDGHRDTAEEHQIPPHRYLFQSYFYQFHLVQLCLIIIGMLDEIIKLEEKRTHARLWTPVGHIFRWNKSVFPEDADKTEDDDPDVIQGLQHNFEDEDENKSLASDSDDLGMPQRRDPDALPPRNSIEWGMTLVHSFIMGLGGGNALFAIKAGLLTVLLCLPSFFKSSAPFAYEHKFIWAVFMGQLTIARFRGDTTFGLIARIWSTLFGVLTGLVIWYISCGSTRGNAFGLAAICGVCFPFFFFVRLYAPIPPMTNAIYFVTICLVIGYSYQDVHISLPGEPGFGWTIAWRRFVLVTIGVVAAFLASFLPPSTTIRRYHRNLLATTSAQLGTVYCAILSFAYTKSEPDIEEIITCLLAVRAKLNNSIVLSTNVSYEFSLRGRWPKERYNKIVDLQIGISSALSNLISVLEPLESSWARALLRRTRFMDPDFQGDVLAVISMISSSLRTGCPLPQITPCPLLDRFLVQYHGLNVIDKEATEDYGLPRSLTLDTLKNDQYLIFSVGVTTACRIINRIDQLMLATKEVVGEHYHIHGVGVSANPILKEGTRPIIPTDGVIV